MLKCRQVSIALVLAVLTMPLAHGPSGVPSAAAQSASAGDVAGRIEKLEAEMRAVQRQVFPGGASKYFQPEFPDQAAGQAAPAQSDASGDLLADMQARLTQLEQQLANLTGQVEEANFRARRVEDTLTRLREDMEYRLTVLEGGDPAALGAAAGAAGAAGGSGAGAPVAQRPGSPATSTAPATTPAAKPGEPQPFPPPGFDPNSPEVSANATDPNAAAAAAAGLTPEEQYKAAYAFVNQNDYPRAEAALKTFIERNPKSSRTPDAMYWLGRVLLVQKSYAQAAKTFLDTYQQHPKANRAPDSLIGLGDALIGLGNPQEACQAFNQLEIDYPSKITGSLKTRLDQGRAKAKCG